MCNNLRLSLAALAVIALGNTALKAEEPRFGIQGQIFIPTGDLGSFMDNKPGIGIGAHGTFEVAAGQVIRPRLDLAFFPNATLNGIENQASNWSLGVDYLYFLEHTTHGVYLTGGLSAIDWTVEKSVPYIGNQKVNTTKLGVSLGAGYNFNRTVGLEGRYTISSVDSSFDANTVAAAITIRF